MSKNPFGTPRAHAHLQRNAFDLSRRDIYSCKAGELIPCFVQEVNPNEHFEIRPDIFLRTQAFNTAAYARMKQKIEFYFVPYRALWYKSDQFFSGTNYSTSSVYENAAPLVMPKVPWLPTLISGLNNTLLGFILNAKDQKLNNAPYLADIFGNDATDSMLKLIDMLGYGSFKQRKLLGLTSSVSDGDVSTQSVGEIQYVTPFRALAYQKIYQDYYRNPIYEPYDNSCNIDDLEKANPNGIVFSANANTAYRLFRPRYACWKKDYFTNLRSQNTLYMSLWMQSGSTLQESTSPSFSNDDLKDVGNLYQGYGNYLRDSSNMGAYIAPFVTSDKNNTIFSAMDVRSLFALEKLLDNMARAKDGSYSAQIEARFGVKPLIDPHLQSVYIGGVDSPVVIGEVVSNSTSSADINGESVASVLGQIAGKGTSSQSNGFISFDSKEHGIIMGIFSIVPESEYNASGLDPFVTKFKRPEFFMPEFDKLGFAPVTMKELSVYGADNSLDFKEESYVPAFNNWIMGFNPMYSEYKTAVDKVHGDFITDGSMSAWCAPRQFKEITYDPDSYGLSISFFHINPSILDPLFAVNATEADQFLVNQWLDVKAIRPMSVNGLPYCN